MPSSCTPTLLDTLSSLAKFNQWYQGKASELDILIGLTTPPTPDNNTTLATASTSVTTMSACLQEQVNSGANAPNTVFQAQEDIINLNESIAQAEAEVAIAKDRVGYIRNPEQHVSNYESWFPIDRPLHTISVIILISLSVFLTSFLTLLLGSAAGYDLTVYIAPSTNVYGYSTAGQFTSSFWLLLIVLISVIIYYRYR